MDASSRDRWLALNYAAAIFTSAFLLFQIQPLVSKHILPWFGGSPAVWTTCLLFFQTLLFAGYAYAHYSHSRLRPRRQALVHMGLVAAAAAFAVLHVLPGQRWEPQGQVEPVSRILILLTISVGLPYFVLSSTGPLLQAWFARSFPGRTPYRLYALSNVGSLLALVSYPFVFEPALALPRQANLWAAGFVLYGALSGYAAWRLWQAGDAAKVSPSPSPSPERGGGKRGRRHRKRAQSTRPIPDVAAAPPAPRWFQRLLWLAWPMFGSVALLATTNHISTDIAVMPFLWIVPLALYLVTFIIAFDRPRWYRRTPVAVLVLVAVYATGFVHKEGVGWASLEAVGTVGLIYSLFTGPDTEPLEFYVSTWKFLCINFIAMFGICMMCHGELVRHRPHPRYLTAFYLMIAAGGALGGAFVTLAAPRLFKTYYEWQLTLVLGTLLAIGFILRALVDFAFGDEDEPPPLPGPLAHLNKGSGNGVRYALLGVVVLAVFLPSAVVLLDLAEYLQPATTIAHLRSRNFFGTLAVLERNADDPLKHNYYLKHGAITHGAQFTHETRRRDPSTYYARTTGVARAIDFYRRELQDEPMKLGVVGLGTGSLAAFADRGDSIVFYEINPDVIEIAESARWFTYLKDCRERGAACEIRLGDARLTLRRELEQHEPQHYHILALDAFSGDAIPVHLLTVEAFEIYLKHLAGADEANGSGDAASSQSRAREASSAGENGAAPRAQVQHGAIAVHISNRYIDLRPVVRAVAQHFGLDMLHIESEDDDKIGAYSSDWVILTRNAALAEELSHFAVADEPNAPTILWTDTHSSMFDVLK